MIVFLATEFCQKLPILRRPVDKTTLEDASQLCALLWSLTDELLATHPVPLVEVEGVIAQFQHGDANLELLLHGALHERSQTFTFADVPQFAALVKGLAEKSATMIGHASTMAPINLEQDEFNLFMEKVRLDLLAFVRWNLQVHDRQHSRQFQETKWQLDRYGTIKNGVLSLMDPKSRNFKIQFQVFADKTSDNLQAVQAFVATLLKVFAIRDKSDATFVSLLNWASPPAISSRIQKLQVELVGGVTNSQGVASIGAVLMPLFGYKRGMLWQATNHASQVLANNNLNGDRSFALLFDGKADERETRPIK